MSKKEIILSITASLFIMVVTASIVLIYNSRFAPAEGNAKQVPKESSFESAPSALAENEYLYIVREFEGRLAVFEKGRVNPKIVYSVYTSHLPAADRQRLAQGIPAKDERELRLIIEDYSS
ncbi:MAG: hypothetical protein LBC56_06660 [Oscillospiraceae bacterium]|jgi:hypothetical protein|nr:hypothetical protein [Oscillospiraceae bacterium]